MPFLVRVEELFFFNKGVPLPEIIAGGKVYLLNLSPELFQMLGNFMFEFRNLYLLLPFEVFISLKNHIKAA